MKKSKKQILYVNGKTEDDMPVLGGIFKFVDTYGLPLDIVVQRLKDEGYVPDWIGFYQDAVKAGWNPVGIISKLEEAVLDVYGYEWKQQWGEKFKLALLALHDDGGKQ